MTKSAIRIAAVREVGKSEVLFSSAPLYPQSSGGDQAE